MKEMIEKRRHDRIDTHVPLKYGSLRSGTRKGGDGSITRDLSEGGMCFRSEKFIPMANRLIVEIDLPEKIKPIKAIAKIAWIKKKESGKDYEIGNKFLEMSKEDRDYITEYVKTFSREDSNDTV